MQNNKTVITITGPSTSGKSTLANFFKEKGYKEIVSTTTRPIRTGEEHGVSYNFVTEEEFTNSLSNDELIEHVKVGQYYYGVSKKAVSDVLNNGFPAVLVVEPNGANRLAEFCKQEDINIHKVFINNTMDILIERLKTRYETDANAREDVYKDRLWNISFIEPKEWTAKAYSGEHKYHQIFDTFVLENQQEVFNSILLAVDKLGNLNTMNNKRKP